MSWQGNPDILFLFPAAVNPVPLCPLPLELYYLTT